MALLAQDPGDGVHDVGFTAAVGPNDAGQPAAAKCDLSLFTERFEAHQLDFAQFEQDFPFKASAVVRWVVPNYSSFGRDVFRFLGRGLGATKSLKGRLAVAQPPGATMAVTGNKVSTRCAQCKDTTGERLTTSRKAGSLYFLGRSYHSP